MAYGAVVTVSAIGVSAWQVTIAETDCGPADEATITGMPKQGRIRRQTTVLASGTGTTVDPILGRATNPSGINVIVENETAAATVDTEASATYELSGTNMFHRSRPDAGADNVINTIYNVMQGW